jgi:hypothetical protein
MAWLRIRVPALTGVPDVTIACQRRSSPDDGITAVFTGMGTANDRRRIADELNRELTTCFVGQAVYICFCE